jgi:hypothetical protein
MNWWNSRRIKRFRNKKMMTITELKAKIYDLIIERERITNQADSMIKSINEEINTTQSLINELLNPKTDTNKQDEQH